MYPVGREGFYVFASEQTNECDSRHNPEGFKGMPKAKISTTSMRKISEPANNNCVNARVLRAWLKPHNHRLGSGNFSFSAHAQNYGRRPSLTFGGPFSTQKTFGNFVSLVAKILGRLVV